MAKLNVCDVCHYRDNKLTEATVRSGFTHHTKVDLCDEHRSSTEGLNLEQFNKFYMELLSGALKDVRAEVVENPKMVPVNV